MTELSASPDFPLVITAPDPVHDVPRWIEVNRNALLVQLEKHGAILLRGFDLVTDQDFDAAVSAFNLPGFTYEESLSNAVRTNRTEKVFTANEAPAEIEIFLHHEMAQTPVYPSKLFFYCEQAPGSGGATPLCRSDWLLTEMKRHMPGFVSKCQDYGLRYTNVMPSTADANSGQGRSWKSTLSCENEAQAERRLKHLGYRWEWQDDGSLRVTTPILPAIRTLESGVEVFFNQLIAAFMGWKDSRNQKQKSVWFGNDSEIADGDLHQLAALAEQLTYDLCWQTGDMAVVDNFLVMHGRRPFKGERRVLASLAA